MIKHVLFAVLFTLVIFLQNHYVHIPNSTGLMVFGCCAGFLCHWVSSFVGRKFLR